MSDTSANIEVSEDPPLIAGSGGGIDPQQMLAEREVRGIASEFLQPRPEDIVQKPGQTQMFGYKGQNLVDNRGVIVRPQYSMTYDEAYRELARMDPAERKGFLQALYKTGAYEGSKPSNTGFDNRDFAAVVRAMAYANPNGVTLERALPMMLADPTISKSLGGGVRVRTTPKQDLRQVFNQASQSVLGRNLSDAEVEKFVRAYQGMEVSEQRGGAIAPSPQAAAIEQVEQQNQTEADAVGMMRLAEAFNQAIRGLG